MNKLSVADKLITIANNTPLVCENLGTKKTVSGNTVFVGDVSAIQHDLKINLTSDKITDLSNITVSRYGKNLIPHKGTMTTQWNGMIISYDEIADTYTINGTCTNLGNGILSDGFYFPITDLTLRMGVEVISGSYTTAGSNLKMAFSIFEKGSSNTFWSNRIIVRESIAAPKTFIAPPVAGFGGYKCTLYIQCWDIGAVFDNFTFRIYTDRTNNIGYEPYKEPQTAISDADGVVNGLTSLSPNITLVSNNDNAVIECSYRLNENLAADEKFIELQEAFARAKETLKE